MSRIGGLGDMSGVRDPSDMSGMGDMNDMRSTSDMSCMRNMGGICNMSWTCSSYLLALDHALASFKYTCYTTTAVYE